ncbi:sensor histidine kinase [Nonomuraea sp. NPDC004297]
MITTWRARPVLVRDGALAVLAALVIVGYPLLGPAADTARAAPSLLWVALVCAACAPLTLRRRLPMTAALASCAAVLLAKLLDQPETGTWVTVAAFASAAYHAGRRRWPPTVAVVCWLLVLDLVQLGSLAQPTGLITSVTSGLAPVAFGHVLRLRHDHAEQAALLRLAQERARIAREVHDVVGHHLSAIRLQAVGARRATSADAGQALTVIAEISATALAETRRLLGLLRDDHPADGDADLRALVARLSHQGLRVRLDGAPPGEDVPPQVRYAVYRIVQESLTNVMRHSGVRRAAVRIGRADGALTAAVEDDGHAVPGQDAPGESGGLRGMRDRVTSLGGTFSAGPRSPHGWRVSVRIPVGCQKAERPDASGDLS